MLNDNIAVQFKVSNTPNMTRLEHGNEHSLYGKPEIMLLFNNDTLFRSSIPPTKALEMLF